MERAIDGVPPAFVNLLPSVSRFSRVLQRLDTRGVWGPVSGMLAGGKRFLLWCYEAHVQTLPDC